MKLVSIFLALGLAAPAFAQSKPAAAESAAEVLPYAINYFPSGLGLGVATLSAKKDKTPQGEEQWRFELRLDVSVPGFPVVDHFVSDATAGFCSATFEKNALHGKRKTRETISFDAKKRTATRQTTEGGKSEISTPACAKDPLAFLFFARQELKAGRIPASQPVFYGAGYQVRLEAAGTQSIQSGDTKVEADKVVGTIKGPATEAKFEMLFARDPVRTPLLIKVPFAIGTIAMELAR
jgi:hypothetical protein